MVVAPEVDHPIRLLMVVAAEMEHPIHWWPLEELGHPSPQCQLPPPVDQGCWLGPEVLG